MSSRRVPGPTLSYEGRRKLDSGARRRMTRHTARSRRGSALTRGRQRKRVTARSLPSFPRKRQPSGRQRVASSIVFPRKRLIGRFRRLAPSATRNPHARDPFAHTRNRYVASRPQVNSPPIPTLRVGRPATPGGSRVGLFRANTELICRESASSVDSQFPVDPHASRGAPRRAARDAHILSIIAWPKPEQDTCVEPGIRRAKS